MRHLRFCTPARNPLEKNNNNNNSNDWATYSYDPMTKKIYIKYQIIIDTRGENELKFPHIQDFSSIINSLGLIKLIPVLPQRDNPQREQRSIFIRANLSTIWPKIWFWKYDHRKINLLFDSVVTVFFSLQRKFEGKIISLESLPWGNSSNYALRPELSGSLI